MDFKITNSEIDAIKQYKNDKYIEINQLLTNNVEIDISLATAGKQVEYSQENVLYNIDLIRKIYQALIKSKKSSILKFYKSTSIAEIDNYRKNIEINQFLFVYPEKNELNMDSVNIIRPVLMEINIDENIPVINLSEILEDDQHVIIAPFSQVVKVENQSKESELYESYTVKLEKQVFKEDLNSIPIEDLFESIIERANFINIKIDNCVRIDKELFTNDENIKKLEGLLDKRSKQIETYQYADEEDKQCDIDDVGRITKEIANINDLLNELQYERNQETLFINVWKNDIALYLKIIYQKLFEEYRQILENESCNKYENYISPIENKEENENELEKNVPDIIEVEQVYYGENIQKLINDCNESILRVNRIIESVKILISKQQNYARIAESVNSKYKALNNAFEIKKQAEKLLELLEMLLSKTKNTSNEDFNEIKRIEEINTQINILLNYLSNPKSALSKKISRFDEINIIEENEFKKDIAETIKNLRCEAELKKLNDDYDIIEDKSKFKKFIGKFTGRNKFDLIMIDQIHVRQDAIRKSYKTRMSLAHNYSIHEMIADIDMFIEENIDDDLISDFIDELRNIKNVLKKNFVIIDKKVISIIDEKTGKFLPMESRKMSKEEILEIDTYKFLKKYGYDNVSVKDEPEYKDTLANEIKRIIEYIDSCNII